MYLRSILDLYSFRLPTAMVAQLRRSRLSGWRLFYWFWHTNNFKADIELSDVERSVSVFLSLAMLTQAMLGVGFLVEWVRYGTAGAWEFGLALLLAYPLVWVHIVVIFAWVCNLAIAVLHPKKAARSFVCTILEMQVRQLRARHHVKVVAVVGSVGKTSTKLAIAQLLGETMRVRCQTGNYNDRVTVPLIFFGINEPSLYNVVAWIKVFGITQSEIAMPYPYDVVVVELGTDGPGQMEQFAYIKPDITVVTAISEEHMEFFGTMDKVAKEELSVFAFSKQVLVNGDDIPGKYLAGKEFIEYSLESNKAQYYGEVSAIGLGSQKLHVRLPDGRLESDIHYLGPQGAKIALAAASVANMFTMFTVDIAKGLSALRPFSGRMQVLDGEKETMLIDDTYNASPLAMTAALDVLYASKAKQRIAILGDMNELGEYSKQAHEEVGAYCDSKKLDYVVTVGYASKKWLAPAAKAGGCTVKSFENPREAGEYVSGLLHKGAVVLAKGSQNGVYAEEALKVLLADQADAAKLVRQSANWMTRKQKLLNS